MIERKIELLRERMGASKRIDEVLSVVRGTETFKAGMQVEIRTPDVAGEARAPNGRNYHVKMRASTGNVARDAGIIPMDAWKAGGLARYKENPILLAYHNHRDPIGISVHTEISKKEQSLIEYWLFHEESETSRMMKKLYEGGFMRAASVGFLVHDFEILDEKQEKEMQELLGTRDPIYWVATRAELLETSAVPVPADPYALAIEHAVENGRAFGIDTEWLANRGFPKERQVAEKTEVEKLAETAEAERKTKELSGAPAAADSSKEVKELSAKVEAQETSIKELRTIIDALTERLAKVETREVKPASTEVVDEDRTEEEDADEAFVEIEVRDGETQDQAVARYVSEHVGKITGAPVAK